MMVGGIEDTHSFCIVEKDLQLDKFSSTCSKGIIAGEKRKDCILHAPLHCNFIYKGLVVCINLDEKVKKGQDNVKQYLIGMISPRTGAPSIISYFASVSLSLFALLPDPVDSRLRISTSMCFSFILTCRQRLGFQFQEM